MCDVLVVLCWSSIDFSLFDGSGSLSIPVQSLHVCSLFICVSILSTGNQNGVNSMKPSRSSHF